MLSELGQRIVVHSEKFINELGNIKKTQSEMKNSIAEVKNTLEEMNIRLSDTEECINTLEDK